MFSRILIVGLGSIGKRHKELVHQLFPNAAVEVLRMREKTIPIDSGSEFLTTIQDAREFSPEIAVLSTPSTTHISLALDLAKGEAHLLIEKPISQSSEGVLELIEECAKKGIALMVGYNLRYLKSLQEFRRHVSEGLIGKPLSVRCEVGQHLPNWRPNEDYRKSVSARSELGGGVMLELSHEIDYLRWKLSKPARKFGRLCLSMTTGLRKLTFWSGKNLLKQLKRKDTLRLRGRMVCALSR